MSSLPAFVAAASNAAHKATGSCFGPRGVAALPPCKAQSPAPFSSSRLPFAFDFLQRLAGMFKGSWRSDGSFRTGTVLLCLGSGTDIMGIAWASALDYPLSMFSSCLPPRLLTGFSASAPPEQGLGPPSLAGAHINTSPCMLMPEINFKELETKCWAGDGETAAAPRCSSKRLLPGFLRGAGGIRYPGLLLRAVNLQASGTAAQAACGSPPGGKCGPRGAG